MKAYFVSLWESPGGFSLLRDLHTFWGDEKQNNFFIWSLAYSSRGKNKTEAVRKQVVFNLHTTKNKIFEKYRNQNRITQTLHAFLSLNPVFLVNLTLINL